MQRPLTKRTNERLYADFKQAAALLDDDQLLWSQDLEVIRKDLAIFLSDKASLGSGNHPALIDVVQKLLADENNLAIGE